MKFIRFLLFPFAILYQLITGFRNFLFDKNIIKSHQFELPVICVGNLNVGGTGKTPQIEYLIRLLSDKYKVATLSRGYKRLSKGFVLANKNETAQTLGDEPYQFFSKFKNIQVAVDADRKNGIQNLLNSDNKPEIILLDDAYQHRKVKAGFYVLLTSFNDLYVNDYLLPTGNLRESRSAADRANVIIVTKCPKNLSENEQLLIRKKLNIKPNQNLFFSLIDYDEFVFSENKKINLETINSQEKLIIAGIANPKPFFEYLKRNNDATILFADHHDFSENDIQNIKNQAQNKLIITTEKDFVRLKIHSLDNLYYLPIKSSFIKNENLFDELIYNYINLK